MIYVEVDYIISFMISLIFEGLKTNNFLKPPKFTINIIKTIYNFFIFFVMNTKTTI
jgi:hypothetical protein